MEIFSETDVIATDKTGTSLMNFHVLEYDMPEDVLKNFLLLNKVQTTL